MYLKNKTNTKTKVNPKTKLNPKTNAIKKSKNNKTNKKSKTSRTNKNNTKLKKHGGQIQLPFHEIPNSSNGFGLDRDHYPIWEASTMVQLFIPTDPNGGREPIYLYSSSLPDMYDYSNLFNTLSFYMYRKNINRIVSLQDCANNGNFPPHREACNGLNDSEDRLWYTLKNKHNRNRNDGNIQFINIFIQDMTAGTINAWNAVSDLNVDRRELTTLIHCKGGMGRTGSILLFFIFKYMFMDSNLSPFGRNFSLDIFDPFFDTYGRNNVFRFTPNYITGTPPLYRKWILFENSNEMFLGLRNLLQNNIEVSDNPRENNPPPGENNPRARFNSDILRFRKANIIGEVFDIFRPYKCVLLVQRINYIIISCAYENYYWGPDGDNEEYIMLYDITYAAASRDPPNDLFVPLWIYCTWNDLMRGRNRAARTNAGLI